MKRFVYIILALALFASCTKDDEAGGTTPSKEFRPTDGIPRVKTDMDFEVNLLEEDAETRTALTQDGKKIIWAVGDSISAFALAKSAPTGTLVPKDASNVAAPVTGRMTHGAGSRTAIFAASGIMAGQLNDYCAYYPAQTAARWKNGTVSNGHSTSGVRTQDGFNQRSAIGQASVLAGVELDRKFAKTIPVERMYHQVAYYGINLDALTERYAGNTIVSVKFEAFSDAARTAAQQPVLFGNFEIDWTKVKNGTGVVTSATANGKNAITVNCSNMTIPATPTDGHMTVYLSTLPITGVNNYLVTVMMKDATNQNVKYVYSSELNSDMTFLPGYMYLLDLDAISNDELIVVDERFGQDAYVYYGGGDIDLTKPDRYLGDGWVDTYETQGVNFAVDVFRFRTAYDVELIPPASGNIRYTNRTNVASWIGKKGDDSAVRPVKIPGGTTVHIEVNLAKGEFDATWSVKARGFEEKLNLYRKNRMSYTGAKELIKYTEVISQSDPAGMLTVSSSDKSVTVKPNTDKIITNATHETTDAELGYRAAQIRTKNASGRVVYNYISQIGLGFSKGTIKMAKVRRTGEWTYFVTEQPKGPYDVGTWQEISEVGNELLFMIGKTEGLEINPLYMSESKLGTNWDDMTPENRVSWTYSSVGGNVYGFTCVTGKKYDSFEAIGKENVCELIYPRGYWRKPTNEEVASWKNPRASKPLSKYPVIEAYDRIELMFSNNSVLHSLSAPYIIDRDGGYARTAQAGIKAIVLGTQYYLYARAGTGYDADNVYPLWSGGTSGFSQAPRADVSVSYQHRDASAVLCIRN